MVTMQELHAIKRDDRGKRVKRLRSAGLLPAVLYGEGTPSLPLSIPYKDFQKLYQEVGESTLFTLFIGGTPHTVLIYDIARDPLRGTPIHADFYAVKMDKAIRTKVPIVFLGEAPAVKNEGGILVKVLQEVEVEALPQNLPHELRLDLSSLTSFDSRLSVKDLLLPHGVKIIVDPEDIIVLLEAPRTEEEFAALKETALAEAPVEVKTEQEIKRAVKMEEKAEAGTE